MLFHFPHDCARLGKGAVIQNYLLGTCETENGDLARQALVPTAGPFGRAPGAVCKAWCCGATVWPGAPCPLALLANESVLESVSGTDLTYKFRFIFILLQ